MKTCKNCKHLRKDERFGEHDPRWKCDNYKDEEGKESSFDRLGDNEAAADNGNCVNWAEKKPVEEQSVETETETTPSEQTLEIDPKELEAARDRRDSRMRQVRSELYELESRQAACRKEANGYKKPIAKADGLLGRLISMDVRGFIALEEEERRAESLPLIEAAERKANEWKRYSIDKLDLPEKDREKLLKHFELCGEVAEWLCRDYPEKKEGCNGKAFRDRVVDAINKISGADAMLKQQSDAMNLDVEVAVGDGPFEPVGTVQDIVDAADDADEPPKGLQEAVDAFNNMR